MKKGFFQQNILFALGVSIYSIGIFAIGFWFLDLSDSFTVLQEQARHVNLPLLALLILVELLLGLLLLIGFYVQWQRKKAKGDIIYVDRYVSEEISISDEQETVFSIETAKSDFVALMERDFDEGFFDRALAHVCGLLNAGAGALYRAELSDEKREIVLLETYAFALPDKQTVSYEFGEGIVGQVAKLEKDVYIHDVPESYLRILSGLGSSRPASLFATPLLYDTSIKGVLELASFQEFTDTQQDFIHFATEKLARKMHDFDFGSASEPGEDTNTSSAV